MEIPAKVISQEQLNQDFWLVTLETSAQINSWQLGTSFSANQNCGTLLYPNKNPTLLSNQAWEEITEVTIKLPQNQPDPKQPTNQLWLGENLGQATVFDAAKRWNISQTSSQDDPYPAKTPRNFQALLATDSSFIFTPKPAKFILPLQAGAIGASQLLEDYKIPNRLASQEFIAGCYNGDLIDLYLSWLENLQSETSPKSAKKVKTPEEISSQKWQVFAATSQETFNKIYQASLDLETTPTHSSFALHETPTHSPNANIIQLIKI